METILIYLVLALVAGGILMMLGFGLKNASHRLGGESKLGLAAFALPVLVLVIVFAVSQDVTVAFVWTAIIVAASGLLALLISGVRSLVS